MANAEIAIKRTKLRFEGGYFNSKYDSGKATMWGVTQAVARRNGYKGDMRNFPKDMAIWIYKKDYWNPLSLNNIDQRIANELYDTAVNCGTLNGGKVFQKALNILNTILLRSDKTKKLYADLIVDGKIGRKTLAAYAVLEKRKELKYLYAWVIFYRAIYYEQLIVRKKSQEAFARSWTRRLFDFVGLFK